MLPHLFPSPSCTALHYANAIKVGGTILFLHDIKQ
jgi:hypothetical protein